MTLPNNTPNNTETEKARLVDEILRPRHLLHDVALMLSTLNEAGKKQYEELKAAKDTERANLMVLSMPQLQAMHQAQLLKAQRDEAARKKADDERKKKAAEKAAMVEASKLYNLASSDADFCHWAAMDFWTIDEAIVLLLGKDPRIVTRAYLQSELSDGFSLLSLAQPQRPKSEFLRRYEDLRAVAQRAAAMKRPQLRPIDAVLWASQSGATTPPHALVKALLAKTERMKSAAQSTSVDNAELPEASCTPVDQGTSQTSAGRLQVLIAHVEESKGSGKKWTPELLHLLQDLRSSMGPKPLSEAIGLSDRRIRQLLEKPEGDKVGSPSPFGQLIRHR